MIDHRLLTEYRVHFIKSFAQNLRTNTISYSILPLAISLIFQLFVFNASEGSRGKQERVRFLSSLKGCSHKAITSKDGLVEVLLHR